MRKTITTLRDGNEGQRSSMTSGSSEEIITTPLAGLYLDIKKRLITGLAIKIA